MDVNWINLAQEINKTSVIITDIKLARPPCIFPTPGSNSSTFYHSKSVCVANCHHSQAQVLGLVVGAWIEMGLNCNCRHCTAVLAWRLYCVTLRSKGSPLGRDHGTLGTIIVQNSGFLYVEVGGLVAKGFCAEKSWHT
jgi:hypothetical protein